MYQKKNQNTSRSTPGRALKHRARQSLIDTRPLHNSLGLSRLVNTLAFSSPPLIKSRLKLGEPDDRYEQEANRVADKVMRIPEPRFSPDGVALPPAGNERAGSGLIRRACTACTKEFEAMEQNITGILCPGCSLQRSIGVKDEDDIPVRTRAYRLKPALTLTADIAGGVHSLRGGGRPLSHSERQLFEPRFGYDFSQVRIHTDSRAAGLAGSIYARAFTLGRDVVFGSGLYRPSSTEGKRLMAHELTHVVQQSNSQNGALSLVQRDATPSTGTAAAGGLTEEMLRQIARRLREAMRGWGTDEEAIYSSFSGRKQEQVDAIARVYGEMYQRSLTADLRDELTDSEMRRLAIFSPTAAVREGEEPARTLADMIAQQLVRAMDRIGTDEESIYAALTGRTIAERRAVKASYRRLTGRELEADIQSEFSGSELIEALRLLNQGMLEPEDELYLAIAGAGTDETTLFRVLQGLGSNVPAIRNMVSAYRRKYGDLVSDLRDDLSAAEYARACRLLRLLSGYIPDVRYSSRKVYGHSRRDATKLYGVQNASNLVPASGFDQEVTNYTDYTKKWENRLNLNQILGSLANDCNRYARHLIGLTGRTPGWTKISRPGIALRPAADLQPGEAYFIKPVLGGAGEAVQEDILSPWNNTETVRKRLTNFHVATVVARDNTTVVTSEVNAAFEHRVNPWFSMYQGNRGFFRTYRREYRSGRLDPELYRI